MSSFFLLVSCDRWIRSQFPTAAQRWCTPRTAIYAIISATVIDFLLHSHLLTPLFGSDRLGLSRICGAIKAYPSYAYFFNEYWPIITILTVTILPSCCMILCLTAITINVHLQRKRVQPIHSQNAQDQQRSYFLNRQMFILMMVNLSVFFLTTLPVAFLRFAISTLKIQQAFSLSLLLVAIFGVITTANYSLNFYLHCLTSKLFRNEFCRWFLCSSLVRFKHDTHEMQQGTNQIHPQRQLTRLPPGATNPSTSPRSKPQKLGEAFEASL